MRTGQTLGGQNQKGIYPCLWQLSFPSFESFKATVEAKIKVKNSSSQCLSPSDKRSCLQGYLRQTLRVRKLTLQRKREEYFGFIEQYYDSRNEEHHQDTYRQVRHHLLPFCPLVVIFSCGSWKCSWGYRFGQVFRLLWLELNLFPELPPFFLIQ